MFSPVLFTPSDTTDYTGANGNVSLVVLPASLTVTASNASRAYGQANPPLRGHSSHADLQNSDNITATYSCVASSSSPAVTRMRLCPHGLVDPGNRQTNYAVSLINGALTVTQALPAVTWTNPVAIIYGTALSSNQLERHGQCARKFCCLQPNQWASR